MSTLREPPASPSHRLSRVRASLLLVGLAAVALVAISASSARAADWPTYRHDVRRSSATDESLAFPLRLAWSYTCAQPPEPAWPEQLSLLNRVDFDYAPAPVVAGGLLLFGSTSDDTVRALDAATGEERWHFITGGPVRFSPQVVGERVYVASDDGYVYCLDAKTGKPVWSFRGGPADECLIGNHRMISRWPMRCGLLVDAGTLYCVAGMWGAEGVFVYALKAETGEVMWCRDTAGLGAIGMTDFVGTGVNPQHQGEFGFSGVNPQGPLLASERLLVMPNGFGAPSFFDREGGKAGGVNPGPAGTGGTSMTIDGNRLYCFSKHGQRGNVLNVQDVDLVNGKPGRGWKNPPIPQLNIAPQLKPEEIHDRGKVCILSYKGQYARRAFGLAKAGQHLLVGQEGYVAAETQAEKEIWRAPVEGEAREMAVADGRLYVSTTRGVIYCFESAPGNSSGGDKPAVKHDPGLVFRDKLAGRSVILCYFPKPGADPAAVKGEPVKQDEPKATVEAKAASRKVADLALRQLLIGGWIDRGFAMVVGDADGAVSETLAHATGLRIVNVQTDPAVATALRERLLKETNWNGTRIHVQVVDRLDRLPFAQFFANAVIVAGPLDEIKSDPAGTAKELYRMLHPCGGVLAAPGLTPEQASALAAACGATDAELDPRGPARPGRQDDVKPADRPLVVRGKLPGALDWDSPKEVTADQRVKWPLRPLWFGGPSTMQTHNFRQGADGPTLANGRYFIKGEDSLTAVDAYNGAVLWSRPIPRQTPDIGSFGGLLFPVSEAHGYGKQDGGRFLVANDNSVYLTLGTAFTRGRASLVVELDARTGVQKSLGGPFNPPTPVGLAAPRTWPIKIDDRRSGSVSMEKTARGLVITLVTQNPAPAAGDTWDLCFDFRPLDQRYGLYEDGACSMRVTPARLERGGRAAAPASWECTFDTDQRPWRFPVLEISGEASKAGTRTTVTIPFTSLDSIAGGKFESFDVAVSLNAHDGGRDEPVVRRHLFGDWASNYINNGWARVTLDGNDDGLAAAATGPATAPAPAPGSKPPALFAAFKRGAARAVNKGGSAVAGSVADALRINPLTGEPEFKLFRPAVVCGAPYFSDFVISGRSGIYDFADDSGLRFVGGVKTRCTTPQVVALGMILISDETGHCSCNLPFRTTLSLAPAERRLNEDWALFHDRTPDTQVRQAAINLGAPGDRRDERGTLWLGFPRPPADKGMGNSLAAGKGYAVANPGDWLRFTPPAMQVPLEIETYGGPLAYKPEEDTYTAYGWASSWAPNRKGSPFGPNRVNADRVTVANTDLPWVYASNYRGFRKGVFRLNFIKPLASQACDQPPPLDAALKAPVCAGEPQALLPFTETKIHLRHDATNLYIAARRPAVVNRLGEVSPWSKTTKGEDAQVALDDAMEFFLSDAAGRSVVHLGVAASGARYDALATGGAAEDKAWNGPWKSAVVADEKGFAVELAIPWATLEAAGIDRAGLAFNAVCDQRDVTGEANKYPGNLGRNFSAQERNAEALVSLGVRGRNRCEHFAPVGLEKPPVIPPRNFTVRLHFAELDDVKPGQRVFDIVVQGKKLVTGFDVVKEAGGKARALVKEFPHVEAGETMTIELIASGAAGAEIAPDAAPILSALEFEEENRTAQAAPAGRP